MNVRHLASDITQLIAEVTMRLARYSLVSLITLAGSLAACTSHTPPHEIVFRASSAIQGGTVDQGDPAVVGIVINAQGGMGICSGSLIAPNLVLTARHCVATPPDYLQCGDQFSSAYSASSFRVTTSYNAAKTVYTNQTMPMADGSTWFAVEKVTTTSNNDICGGDMAVLQLSQSISGVCPIVPRVDSNVTQSEGVTMVGFGITSPQGQVAGTRYKVSGSVSCASNCGSSSEMSSTAEFEAGTSSKGTCEGDSGGPALDSSGRVIGTVSRGYADACGTSVYEKVYSQASWIKARVQAAATAGGYSVAGWVNGGSTSDSSNSFCAGTGGSGGSGGGGTGGSGGGSGGSGGGANLECQACTQDSDCGDGVAVGCWLGDSNGDPAWCAYDCTDDASVCPSGSSCVQDSGDQYKTCIPDTDCSGAGGTGGSGGGSGATCDTCAGDAQNGTCSSAAQACANNSECTGFIDCANQCSDDACVQDCVSKYPNGSSLYSDYASCVCDQACPTECAAECGNSGGTGGSAGSGAAGNSNQGGSSNQGGNANQGGSSNQGGNGTGGKGGSTGKGGSSNVGGGNNTSTGGSAGTGGGSATYYDTDDNSSDGNCSVASGPRSAEAPMWMLLAGLAVLGRRRK